MYNTLYVSSGKKIPDEVEDINIIYADSPEESVEQLKRNRVDAVVINSSHEEIQNRIRNFIRKSYLPVSIIHLNGNKNIKMNTYIGNFGSVLIDAPQSDESIKKSIDLVKKHQKLLKKNLHKQYMTLRHGIVEALLQALRIKDSLTYQHVLRMETLVDAFAMYLKLSEEDTTILRLATLLHDVGKIGIMDSILNKTSKLTPVEYEIMKTHVELGCKVISEFKELHLVIPVMRHHHEKLDGSGYPDGIGGDAIPYLAKILTIVDAYDSLTSNRIYRNKRSFNIALQIMQDQLDVAYDGELFEKFKDFIEDSEIFVKIYHKMDR